jgi:hypothetical protein
MEEEDIKKWVKTALKDAIDELRSGREKEKGMSDFERGKACGGINKPDIIRLNQRWIQEAEEKINVLKEEIAVYAIDIKTYRKVISDLEEEEE